MYWSDSCSYVAILHTPSCHNALSRCCHTQSCTGHHVDTDECLRCQTIPHLRRSAASSSLAAAAFDSASAPGAGAVLPSWAPEPHICFSTASLCAFALASAGMIMSNSLGLGGLRWSRDGDAESSWLRLPRPPRLRLASLGSRPWPAAKATF